MSETTEQPTANEVAAKATKNFLTRMREGLTYKDGKFSKTAMFASMANLAVILAYVLSWGAGATFTFNETFMFVVPAFDTSAAIGLLTVINGTYIGNNAIKSRNGNGHHGA